MRSLKRIPGVEPRFTSCELVRPDGTVLKGWEMFVGDRSYGRSTSKDALLAAWEASLEEAENGRPFAFRPAQKAARSGGRQKVTAQTSQRTARKPPRTAQKPQRAAKAGARKKK